MTAAAPVAAAPVAAGAVANPHLAAWRAALEDGRGRVRHAAPTIASGRLTRAVGLVLEAVGLQLPLGADCLVELPPGQGRRHAEAEVVGFSGERLLLMPQTDVSGLLPGARVFAAGDAADASGPGSATKQLPVGAGLLGRVLDAAGRPLDGLGPVPCERKVPLAAAPINPLARAPIRSVLDVGVRAINALLTVGRGQRMGLFAGSGVGKSVLLGMMARYTSADVIVVGLIGERGREVKEFIEHTLGADGLARAVVVAAPADTSPLLRLQGAAYATCLAEFFRDQGRDVLLIMDSLTRYAMAQREIALAVGEPPATKGYPPRFRRLPALVEACRQRRHGGGSITAFYTVLSEGDDQQDPIAMLPAPSSTATSCSRAAWRRRALSGGDRQIEASIARAMPNLVEPGHFELVRRFKQTLSRYQRNRDLVSVGAYAPGHDPRLDEAIALYPRMEAFLQQPMHERSDCTQSLARLAGVFQPA